MVSTRTSRRWWRRGLLAPLAYLLVVACVNFVPQQGWSPASGPVVPHDSFPADCSLCHQGSDWHTLRADFQYDHAKQAGVPLEGAHAKAACLLCHNDRGPVAKYAARGCAGCHEDPHTGQLGANCKDCHDERTWHPRDAIARHDRTRFPLVGAHAAAACFRCHPGAQVGNFAGAAIECIACHQSNFASTTDPNHVLLQFSQDCQTCHLPVGWQPARFAHPGSFPLTNAHAGLVCRTCHTTPNSFGGLSTDCSSCHMNDYTAATEPAHVASGMSTACMDCHDTRTFQHANWQHPGSFAMTFGHAGRKCSQCHANQVYSGTPTDCVGCHQAKYNATTNPNHGAAGFGTDCQTCHNTRDWHGALGHPDSFPLTNAHNRACTSCHTTPGVYTGLSTQCVSCHLSNYNATTDPPHGAFQLSQQCQTCHGTTNWTNVTWTHHFPINSGHHGGFQCFDCHNNPANRPQFSCIDCHEHSQSTTNGHHTQVSGYSYTTAACYQCHPTGHN